MKQEIKNNVYYLFSDEGKLLLKLTPSEMSGNQVVIETEEEVFAGPISLLNLSKTE